MVESYKIYLTKRHDVALLIAKAHNIGSDDVSRVSYGAIFDDDDVIPSMYKRCGYAHCTIVRSTPDCKAPTYEVIFA